MRNPVGLENLVTWLKKQPSAKRYCYNNHGGCLLHQFYTAMGMPIQTMFGDCWKDVSDGQHELDPTLNSIAVTRPNSFGGALIRAEEVLEFLKRKTAS